MKLHYCPALINGRALRHHRDSCAYIRYLAPAAGRGADVPCTTVSLSESAALVTDRWRADCDNGHLFNSRQQGKRQQHMFRLRDIACMDTHVERQ